MSIEEKSSWDLLHEFNTQVIERLSKLEMKNDELYKNCTTTCTSGAENNLTSEKLKEFYDLMNNEKFKLVKRMEINPKFFKVLSKKVKIKEVTKVGYILGMSVYIAPDLKEPYRFVYE